VTGRAAFRPAGNGFSLIELLVVIVIIGLLSTLVVLTMADPRGTMLGDTDRFAGRVRAARDSAVLSGRPVALWVSPTGYGFEKRQAGQWLPIEDGPLASADWSRDTQAAFAGVSQLRAVFDSVGRADRQLEFRLANAAQGVRVSVDLDGVVTSGE
jgi:general secretion pathway protein H